MSEVLKFSNKVDALPVLHGSADFAICAREAMLANSYDCLAVPLPETFADAVLAAIEHLPAITGVFQMEPTWDAANYVPIDPCQPIIAAIRSAKRDRMAIKFIDLETADYEPQAHVMPDPYAIKGTSLEKYCTAVLPSIPRPVAESQHDRRIRRMAFELHRLELEYDRILFPCSILDWPWLRAAYTDRAPFPEHESYFAPIRTFAVKDRTLTFFLGELPYVTALYEHARSSLEGDENLAIDGIKSLVLEARDHWCSLRNKDRDWLTPKLLELYLRYVRNLTLMHRRLTPDLYTLVTAAKQVGGDSFALSLIETAKDYPVETPPAPFEIMRMGIQQGELPSDGVVTLKSRLPGPLTSWKTIEIKPEPTKWQKKKYSLQWDPYRQCSWPPEDERIESFHTHVREQAKALLGADLARSEKFTTSVRDGLDIRETIRHWHTGDLYVKVIPPARGTIEVVLFLFDVPADEKRYNWRTTWHAEHKDESTIGLFATDFRQDIIGPGIGKSLYGGVFFIYPPRYIPDIWTDPRLPKNLPLEEHLLAAACFHSAEKHIAVVAPCAIKASWRRIASKYQKRLIHMPLSRFSGRTIERIRTVHVLNGTGIRSYASKFIREE